MRMCGKLTWGGLLVLLAALMLTSCTSQKGLEEQRRMVAEGLAKRQLHIDIISMNAMRYGGRAVTSDFYLELRGDTLRSYLPYLGQAYQGPMASPSIGLNFEAPILKYQESQPKKDCRRLEMDVRTQEDFYHYIVDVYDTGEAFIRVSSHHRDPISFDGRIQ